MPAYTITLGRFRWAREAWDLVLGRPYEDPQEEQVEILEQMLLLPPERS
jgi:acyl-CoA-binding protein